MEVASGNVADRPFARTVYTVAVKRFTGDVILTQAGKTYKVSWEGGRVTAAESPAPADQYIRVAIAARLLDRSLAAEILNVQAQQKGRPQLELIAELGKLSPEHVKWLKHRGLAARAARQFALAEATYSINNARSLSADPDVPPLDPRWLIFSGVVSHYSIDRLKKEVRPVMSKAVTVSKDAYRSLPAFGFTKNDQPCIERLTQHVYTVPDLVAACRELDEHRVLAIVYSLVACDCLQVSAQATAPRAAPAPTPTQKAQSNPPASPKKPIAAGTQLPTKATADAMAAFNRSRMAKPGEGARKPGEAWSPDTKRKATMARSDLQKAAKGKQATHAVKLPSGFKGGKRITDDEVRALIADKIAAMDAGVDYFVLLGLEQTATDAQIHEAYFHLAKRLHPDRLRALKVLDLEADAQRLFARINQGFATLSNAKKLADYRKLLAAGGEEALRKKQAAAEKQAARIFEAEDQFRQGEAALRRSQFAAAAEHFAQAVKLNPDEGEHHACLAWATWCSHTDKGPITQEVAALLVRAEQASPRSSRVWLYKGLVTKQQGNVDDAEAMFRKAVELDKNNRDAQAELRVMARRQEAGGQKAEKRGLFGKRR